MPSRRRLIATSAIFAIVVASALLFVRVGTAGDINLGHLARVEALTGIDLGPRRAWLAAGLNGDGATFAVVAADLSGAGPGQALREPAYRYSRPAYPYLSSLAVGGRHDLILLGLTAIGLVAVAGTAVLAHLLNPERGWRAWLLIVNPALIVGFLENTAEPLAILILSISLLTGSRLAAAATALTRPSFVLGLAKDWWALAVGLSTALIVKIFWSWRFAEEISSGAIALDFPIRGILQSPSLVGWLVVIGGIVTAFVGVKEKDLGWVLSGLLVMSLSVVVVDTPVNAVRAAGLLPVLWAFGPNYQPHSIRSMFPEPDGGVSYSDG